MLGRGFSYDKYITIALFIGIFSTYLSIILSEFRRYYNPFEKELLPKCFEKHPVLIFSNYYDSSCSNLSVCRRLGEIMLIDCGRNISLSLESDCNSYWLEDFEENDTIKTGTREGIYIYILNLKSNPGDCDILHLNCSGVFFVKISWSNQNISIGDEKPTYCKGKEIKSYFVMEKGVLYRVIEK